jgi:cbb3-type cytochrome oxidase maturation protein
MEALFLLIPLSVAIVAGATWLFLRTVDQGQFDDLDSPAHQILTDDDRPAGGA